MTNNKETRQKFYKYFAQRYFTEYGHLKLIVRKKKTSEIKQAKSDRQRKHMHLVK